MKLRSTLIAAIAVAVVGGAALIGANTVSAQTTGESLVERVSNRFGLNQEEVQGVFDEFRQERHVEKQEMLSEKLQERVDDGTITTEQKTLIEEKLAELHEQRESLHDSDLTREEMHDQMQQTKEDLEQWAEDNDIPVEDLMPFGGEGKRGGFGNRPF